MYDEVNSLFFEGRKLFYLNIRILNNYPYLWINKHRESMKDTLEERKASRKVTAITNSKEIPEFDLLMKCSKHQLADKLTHFLCVIRALRETK